MRARDVHEPYGDWRRGVPCRVGQRLPPLQDRQRGRERERNLGSRRRIPPPRHPRSRCEGEREALQRRSLPASAGSDTCRSSSLVPHTQAHNNTRLTHKRYTVSQALDSLPPSLSLSLHATTRSRQQHQHQQRELTDDKPPPLLLRSPDPLHTSTRVAGHVAGYPTPLLPSSSS